MSHPQPAPARRPNLVPVLVAAFIAIPVFEIWLITTVGALIGVWPTIAILVGEAILGGWLMRREGGKAWKALSDAYGAGNLPAGELADAGLVLVGGVLLMLPGFFTDVVGLLFLLPWTRPAARRLVGFVIAKQAARSGVDVAALRIRYGSGTVISGETVEDAEPPDSGPSRTISGEIEP